MLFVNHHHAEACELHGVLNDSVRADKNLYFASQESVEHLLAFFAFHNACQQFHPYGHVAQEISDGLQMLFGQYLGGCHDTGLVTVVQCDEHRHEGHECLAASHVALQQPVHLATAAHVLSYLADDALLGSCQFKGQVVVEERVEQFAHTAEHVAAVFAAVIARVP